MADENFDAISQEMVDLALEDTYKDIEEKFRPSSEEVLQAAKELTDYAKLLQAENGNIGEQLESLDTSSESSVLNFSKKFIKNATDYTNLMDKVFNFQNLVNEFLGQKVIMTFVSITPTVGKVTLYNMENSVKDLTISRSAESRGGNISGRMLSLRKIKNASSEMIDSQYDKTSLDTTFQEVWQRFRISKNRLKLSGAAYILWNIGGWDGVWISGAGPLGEAYVAFLVNKYLFTGGIEVNVKDFMTNDAYGSINADNASGFLQGDIVKGAANFGVKVKGAQALGYTEIIEYAYQIQQVADIELFLKDLKNKLAGEGSQNMVKPLSQILSEEYKVLLDPLEQRIEQLATYDTVAGPLIAQFSKKSK